MRHFAGVLSALVMWLALSLPARAAAPVEQTLPNGLTVLVLENHAAPVVAVRVYVKTGAIYEQQHVGTGISHLFEHVLGEGTSSRTKEQMNEAVQGMGGQYNAYTSKDVTAYHLTTAASFLPQALEILSDQMMNATFPEAEVKTQQGVIHNEMNLNEDEPDDVLYQLFYRTAFQVHPVRFPIIGYRAAFDRLTREDIVNYYKSHYTPSNSLLAIAGDVQAAEVFKQVQATFGKWEARPVLQPSLPREPRQVSPRRAVLERDVNLAYLMMGWHTIPLQHPDLYPLDVLAEIMGGGESSRLVRRLREDAGLVTSIGAWSSTPNYDAGVFAIRAVMPPANLTRSEAGIKAEIAKAQNAPVTASELTRAKRQIEAAFVFGNSKVENQAEQMAYDKMATGDANYSRTYVARIKAVTPAAIQRVARQYLQPTGLTTSALIPRRPIAPASAGAASASTRAGFSSFRLPNGLRVLLRPGSVTPTVAINMVGLGGVRLEPAAKAGVANLMARMLTRGTSRHTGEQLAAAVNGMGASLDGFSGYNTWGVQSRWLKADWRSGLSLVREVVQQPTFPAAELARQKQQTLASIQQQQDDPMGAAPWLMRELFWGAHPYGRPLPGTQTTVRAMTAADLRRHWQQVLQPAHMVLAVVGDFDPAAMRRAVEYEFGPLRALVPAPVAPAAPAALTAPRTKVKSLPGIAQAVMFWALPGTTIKSEDRYAVDVLDAALSGSSLPGGRLHARLRDNQLVYVVHAFNQPGVEAGMFVIYAATSPARREEVVGIIREELQKVRDGGITPEELNRARTMAIAAQAIDAQGNEAQAQEAATDELLGLGYEESSRYQAAIEKITLEDVQRVAREYLRLENSATAIIVPADRSN